MADVTKINGYNVKDATARSGLSAKQDTLVSGTNIKTINSTSLLGSGNIEIGEWTTVADAYEVTESGVTQIVFSVDADGNEFCFNDEIVFSVYVPAQSTASSTRFYLRANGDSYRKQDAYSTRTPYDATGGSWTDVLATADRYIYLAMRFLPEYNLETRNCVGATIESRNITYAAWNSESQNNIVYRNVWRIVVDCTDIPVGTVISILGR